MPPLPVLSGEAAIRAFAKAGWREDRRRGSHVILIKVNHPATLSVPLHRELAPGTLRALIRSSGLAVEAFLKLM